jgi:hypothetical protein
VVGVSADTSRRSRSRSSSAICFEVGEGDARRRVRVAQDVDPSDRDSITEVDRDAREFDAALPALPPPGTGERYRDCGEEQPLLACPDHGTVDVHRTCRRSRCPRCWQSSVFQRALDADTAVEGLRRYRYASGVEKAKYHHVTLSLPPSLRFARSDPLDGGFKLAYRLLAEVGVDAGYVVYHPWRIVAEYRGDVNGHSSGEGDMTWSDVLALVESDEWTWPAVRDEFLTYAPHFHAVVNATFVQGGAVTEAVEEQTGVVIHRITGGDSSVSLGDLNALAATTAYAVSHAGLSYDDENDAYRVAARKFGEVANIDRRQAVEDDVDAALREVAPDVLGVEFGSPRCDAETVDTDALADHDHAPDAATADGGAASRSPVGRAERFDIDAGAPPDRADRGGPLDLDATTGNSGDYATGREVGHEDSWTASTGVAPDFLDDPGEADDDLRERCGAKLVPIWAAEEWLDDDDWVADHDAETVADLRAALAAWEDRERVGRPAAPPPDASDPPSPPD